MSLLLMRGGFMLASILQSEALCAQVALQRPDVPTALRTPPEQALLLQLTGKGSQIYTCQSEGGVYAWKLKAPEAKLYDEGGQLAGRHFVGPTWQAKDGSRITGKLQATAPAPDASSMPWLLLTVVAHDGSGVLSGVQTIQRLNTRGGLAPTSACNAAAENAETPISYEADYYFYGNPATE